MAEALTYNSLVSDIQIYAERNDEPFLTQIPRFIMLAENRLASEIKNLGMLKVISFNLTIGQPTYQKPARWRETKNFSLTVNSTKVFLKPRGYEYCRVYSSDAAINGVPSFYSDYDYEHWFISQTPDVAYSCESSYFERPEPISDTNQTNWTTQYAPQLLLYASLLEAQPFLKLPERIQEFQMFYERAASAITQEDMRRTTDNSIVRVKQ